VVLVETAAKASEVVIPAMLLLETSVLVAHVLLYMHRLGMNVVVAPAVANLVAAAVIIV
jgi:hypothetical protein